MTSYEKINLKANATGEELKNSYIFLMRKYYDELDNGDSSANDRINDINIAYNNVCTKVKRAKYDLALREGIEISNSKKKVSEEQSKEKEQKHTNNDLMSDSSTANKVCKDNSKSNKQITSDIAKKNIKAKENIKILKGTKKENEREFKKIDKEKIVKIKENEKRPYYVYGKKKSVAFSAIMVGVSALAIYGLVVYLKDNVENIDSESYKKANEEYLYNGDHEYNGKNLYDDRYLNF